MEKSSKLKLLLAAVLLAFVIKCAHQLPPDGGAVDTTPPKVIRVFPGDGTTNFEENYIEIAFSEYVDNRSVQDAVFISPNIEGPEYNWSGTELEIEFTESLRDSTTYNITVGTDAKDLNNGNKMENAFNFVFSTGNKIDRGKIFGKVYDRKPSGIMIFAYKKDTLVINPTEMKPEYISQVGESGEFSISGMAYTDYLVFAVRDRLRNLKYNVEEDEYGVPNKEITLTERDSSVSGLNYFMTKNDTTKPHILSANMTDRYHILLELSEYLDSTKVNANNFSIYDSTENKGYEPKYLFNDPNKKKQKVLVITDSLNEENNVYLISKNLIDKQGNVNEKEITGMAVSSRPDTTAPMVKSISSQNGKASIDFKKPEFICSFNDAIHYDPHDTSIQIVDEKDNPVKYRFEKEDDATIILKTMEELNSASGYKIKIDLNAFIDAAGNSMDSVYTYSFQTINELNFSGAMGKVKVDSLKSPLTVNLKRVETSNTYSQRLTQTSQFKFNRVQPGKYELWVFEDSDSSGIYSYGRIYPFEPSEKFRFYPDTLNLRARWPVGDIVIPFD